MGVADEVGVGEERGVCVGVGVDTGPDPAGLRPISSTAHEEPGHTVTTDTCGENPTAPSLSNDNIVRYFIANNIDVISRGHTMPITIHG